MKYNPTSLMNYKNTTRRSRAGSGLNLLKGCTLMLVMTLMVIGCDSIVDQNAEADVNIATSDISGVLSVDTPPVTCIDPDAGEYNKVLDMKTIEWGNKKNPFSKTVDIEYYNTLTEFVLRVTSSEMIADVLVDDESIKDFDGTVEAGTWQEFTFDLGEDWEAGDTQTFSLKIAGSGPPAYFEVNYELLGECEDIDFGRDTETKIVEVTSATGRIWMDRNLGASRAATAFNDPEAYGDLYQWGRLADGHQIINRFAGDGKVTSGVSYEQSSSPQPDHPNFIQFPGDWLVTQNDDLWQGVDGINNPCPVAYRLPTEAEWVAERQTWSSYNRNGAFASPLKLPVAGYRASSSGSLFLVGSRGLYWSGTVGGTLSRFLSFDSGADLLSTDRAFGFSVRCIKEETPD